MRRLAPFVLLLAAACASSTIPSTVTAPAGAIRIPVEVVSHRVHLPVSVAGNPPVTFILDTGAGTSPLDEQYARKIGIEGRPGGRAMGASGVIDIRLATGVTYAFAGVEIEPERVVLLPLAPVSLRIGRPVAGVLGHDVFRRFVTEFDYARSTVTLHPPESYRPPADAVSVEYEPSHGGLPRIAARLILEDGRTIDARLLVDTGAGAPVILEQHFVEKHGIDTAKTIEAPGGMGVGGDSRTRVGRIAGIEFGGIALGRPVTHFSQATAGALSSPDSDGLIGGEVLSRFTLTIDASKRQLLFVPNAAIAAAFESDMSGLHLTAADETYQTIEVFEVLPATPGADAGLRRGDAIRAIDGRAVSAHDLAAIRELLRTPGRRLALTIVRDGAESTVTLTTRRLV